MEKYNLTDKQIEELNAIVAKIIHLKDEGKLDDAIELSESTIYERFHFDKTFLEEGSIEQFEAELTKRNYSIEQLDILIQLLFESAYPFQETWQCRAVMHKVALLLKIVETKHHQTYLKHLNIREMIDNFLNNDQFE